MKLGTRSGAFIRCSALEATEFWKALISSDFWVTNLIYADGTLALIDWDTSGWGYLGEDLASLIADEADIDHMVEYDDERGEASCRKKF